MSVARRAFTMSMICRFFVVGSLVALAGCGQVRRPDGGSGLLPEGAAAPDLQAESALGQPTKLSAMKGHAVVVYFYPQDGTPGCTKEACAFRDAWKKLNDANIEIIGVSTNSVEKHREFRTSHHLPFPLASDENGAIGTSYGVTKHLWGYDRVSFLVDKEGKVAKVWPSVDPGVHADEVLKAAAELPQTTAQR